MIVMVCVSVIATGFVMHLSATTQQMPRWVEQVFLEMIPCLLCLQPGPLANGNGEPLMRRSSLNNQEVGVETISGNIKDAEDILSFLKHELKIKNSQAFQQMQWRRVSMVIDRLLLVIFIIFIILCTLLLTIEIITGSEERFDDIKLTLAENW